MQNLLLVVALSVAVGTVNTALRYAIKTPLRIRETRPNEYEFVVRIEETRIFVTNVTKFYEKLMDVSTGSLITPTWVLSCGHCIQGDVKNYRIRFGDMTNYTDIKSTRKAIKLIRYPSSKTEISFERLHQNDVGLVLVEKVPCAQVARLSMVEYTSLVGLPATYVGFRPSRVHDTDIYIPLKVEEGGIIPCDDELPVRSIPGICIAPKCNDLFKSSFTGDFGGPLFYDRHLVGIAVSGVMHKSKKGVAVQVFVPVSPFMDWIESMI